MSFETRWATGVSALAAATVESRLRGRFATTRQLLDQATPHAEVQDALEDPGAGFVTLTNDGRLRGCIGNLVAIGPLAKAVIRNARRAMTDPRTPPVTTGEWPQLTIEVSVLSAPEAIEFDDRSQLLAALRPGVDGLILRQGDRRATFLPSVWKSLTSPERFVAALLTKGGWDGWPADMRAERYTAKTYTDHPPRPQLEPT